MDDLIAKAALIRAVENKSLVDIRIEDEEMMLDAQLKLTLDKVFFDENEKHILMKDGKQQISFNYENIEVNTLPTNADKFYIQCQSSTTTVVVPR